MAVTGTIKRGPTTSPWESQSVGTTKWMYVVDTTADSPTCVRGAEVPIQGTNAPTKDSLPLQESQNGGQKYNAPMHDNELGFSP